MGKRIAVLGAGPMGLAVAYQLARDGHCPVIYEADDRIGGMTASFDFSGQKIERYYHFHCISDHAFLKVLDELGIGAKMRWVKTRMGYWYLNQVQDWGNPVALLKFKGLSLTAKVRYGAHAFLSTKRDDWKPLDDVEATGWIKRWVGDEAYEVLWRRLFEYKFHHFTGNLSAAWIWSRIRRIGRSRYDLFNEKLGYLEGGSETLLQAMHADILKNGGQIHLRTPVQEVLIEDGKAAGLLVEGERLTFDRVISTIPIPYIPKVIPGLPAKALEQFKAKNNIAVVCVIVKLRKALTRNFWLNTNDPEMDIPGIVEYSNLHPLKDHIVYVPFYIPQDDPKYRDDNQVFIDKVKRYFRKINPSLQESDFIDAMASRYYYAQPICQPSYMDSLPPVNIIEGLWVADTSYYYPEDRGISESIDFGRQMAKDAAR
ncbi:NAD(P)/FAD-dependent oxidoreductase [Pseudomonas sp. UBA4194]|uniref:NAD(P)/FAD-dependent oxidoreductase n=1 Tax=Pseudomonas sp. UBA4194 TaxID=1947317 RepID=UPI0025F640CC|nr:NAD(P)/FAD-dependent oxidoreductase [Pseudomonas sp. UBA4194]